MVSILTMVIATWVIFRSLWISVKDCRATLGHRYSLGVVAFKFMIFNLLEIENKMEIT